jgi:pyruvate kinase
MEGTDHSISDITSLLKEKGLVKKDDIIINTMSMPLGERQRTNAIKITVV